MKNQLAVVGIFAALLLYAQSAQAQYSAVKEGDVVRLVDKKTDTVVSIVPSMGAVVFEMKIGYIRISPRVHVMENTAFIGVE